jgi:Regulator of chromosome condensation (RCC1) repeat
VIDRGLRCWGSNTYGQLGRWAVVPGAGFLPPLAIDLPPGAPIRDLAVGSATFLLREDGTTLSWGANPPIARVSPLFPDPNPALTELESIASLDPVQDHACAVARGAGYCWGARLLYQHPLLDRASPERVVAPEPLAQIATTMPITVMYGGTASIERPRWCAVSGNGNVYCWGNNGSGQAGDGTKDHAFDAVQVVGLPAPAAQVRTMPSSTCALLTSGKIFCWGSNVNGQLGSKKPRGVFPNPQEVVLP